MTLGSEGGTAPHVRRRWMYRVWFGWPDAIIAVNRAHMNHRIMLPFALDTGIFGYRIMFHLFSTPEPSCLNTHSIRSSKHHVPAWKGCFFHISPPFCFTEPKSWRSEVSNFNPHQGSHLVRWSVLRPSFPKLFLALAPQRPKARATGLQACGTSEIEWCGDWPYRSCVPWPGNRSIFKEYHDVTRKARNWITSSSTDTGNGIHPRFTPRRTKYFLV